MIPRSKIPGIVYPFIMSNSSFLIGTSGWNYDDWKGGIFYPEDLPKRQWLEYYATQFPTVEINATFYRNFQASTYHKWYEQVSHHFRYVLKAPRVITHYKQLKNVKNDIRTFEKSASLLKDKLGLILLQLSPRTPYDPQRLEKALRAFKNPHKVAVEFRDEKWFTDEIFALLTRLGVTFCIADSPITKLFPLITTNIGYIRLHGHTVWYDYEYSRYRLEKIAKLAKDLLKQGAKTIYIFFNNDVNAYAINNATMLKRLLKIA